MTVRPHVESAPEAQEIEDQATPLALCCPSCNSQAQRLPNGQLWCSPCNAAVVVDGGNPTAERLQGFAIGLVLSIVGVIAVAVLSEPPKQGNRLLGAVMGMGVWLALIWVMGAFDPWLAQYGLNANNCRSTLDGVTCTGLWSPQ